MELLHQSVARHVPETKKNEVQELICIYWQIHLLKLAGHSPHNRTTPWGEDIFSYYLCQGIHQQKICGQMHLQTTTVSGLSDWSQCILVVIGLMDVILCHPLAQNAI